MKQLLLLLMVSTFYLISCNQKTSALQETESVIEKTGEINTSVSSSTGIPIEENNVEKLEKPTLATYPTTYDAVSSGSMPYMPPPNDISGEEAKTSTVVASPRNNRNEMPRSTPVRKTRKGQTKTTEESTEVIPTLQMETSASLSSLSDNSTSTNISQVAKTISGRLVEYFPDTMEVGTLSRIVVEISPDTSSAGLQMEIQQHSTLSKNKESIKTSVISGIGENMRASLKGDKKHFEIEAMTENNLRKVDLSSKKFIRWEWDVRPLTQGNHPLSLVLERLDGEASDPIPILTKDIAVMVEKTFLRSYGILIGGFALALLGGLFFYFKKKKDRTKELAFQHKDKIFKLVGENKTAKALSLLESTFANEHLHDEVMMIKSRFNDIKERELKGILDSETISLERNKINSDILNLIKDLNK